MRTSAVALAALGSLGAIGLLALTSARADQVAAAEPPAAGGAVERRVYPERASASTFLWNDWNKFQENYLPMYAADGDPKTAWVEGAAGAGEKEWLRFELGSFTGTTALRVRLQSGYQKSPVLYKANARPARLTFTLLPSNHTVSVEVADKEGFQEFVLPQPAGVLEAVEIAVDKVYPGSKYADLCISDVEFFVTATAAQNPALEKGKADRIATWKAERVRFAKEMKGLVADAPLPILPSYKFDPTWAEDFDYQAMWEACKGDRICRLTRTLATAEKAGLFASLEPSLALAQGAVKQRFAGFVPVTLALRDRRAVPQVDNLGVPWLGSDEYGYGMDLIELPSVGTLSVFEAAKLGEKVQKKAHPALAKVLAGKAPGCRSRTPKTFVWAMIDRPKGEPSRVRALLIARCGLVEQREGESLEGEVQIVTYDERGHLELVIGASYVNRFVWQEATMVGARTIRGDGSRGELTAPPVAAK